VRNQVRAARFTAHRPLLDPPQVLFSRVDVRCRSAPPHALPSRGALWNECLITSSHTVEKSLFFARRVTLGSSEIRFIVMIVRCGPVVDRRLRWRVVGTNNSVPPVCVMHRSRVRRATQGDQKAQGQNRTHRFFSNRPRCTCLGKAQVASSKQIAASRLVTSVASRDLRCVTASLTPRDAVPDRRIAAAPPSSVMSFRRFMCPPGAQFCSSLALCRPPASEKWHARGING
jgi:hypothetical protein